LTRGIGVSGGEGSPIDGGNLIKRADMKDKKGNERKEYAGK